MIYRLRLILSIFLNNLAESVPESVYEAHPRLLDHIVDTLNFLDPRPAIEQALDGLDKLSKTELEKLRQVVSIELAVKGEIVEIESLIKPGTTKDISHEA